MGRSVVDLGVSTFCTRTLLCSPRACAPASVKLLSNSSANVLMDAALGALSRGSAPGVRSER